MDEPATTRRRCEELERRIDLMKTVIDEMKDALANIIADLPTVAPTPDEAALPAETARPHRYRVRRTRRSRSEPPESVAYVLSRGTIVEMFTDKIEKAIANITSLCLLQDSESENLIPLGIIKYNLMKLQHMPGLASVTYAVQALIECHEIVDQNGPFAIPFEVIPKQITDVVCLACCRDIDPYDTDAYRAQIDNAFGGELTELMASKICNARWQVFERPHQ